MKRLRVFPGIIFVLMGMSVCLVALTVFLAGSDRSFAVESNYYQKALNWDATQRQNTQSRELGWTVRVATEGHEGQSALTVRVGDSEGRPVERASVGVVAFHNARAADRFGATLTENGPGVYSADMELARPGQWQFQISVKRGVDEFTATLEHSVAARTGSNP